MAHGVFTTLASANLPIALNGKRNLRLEAVGDSLRAYVNGQLMLEAADASFAEGAYGLVMYKAATRYTDFLALQP